MKVLHINSSVNGGAATACLRLHRGLMASGVDSHLLVLSASKSVPNCSVFSPKRPEKRVPTWNERVRDKLHRLAVEFWLSKPRPAIDPSVSAERQRRHEFLSSRPKGLSWFSYPDSGIDIMESEAYHEADLIHLHWVAGFLDWKSFFSKNRKPVLWTLHDQNVFLGGRHVAERFLGMNDAGLPLPYELSQAQLDEERMVLQMKSDALEPVDHMSIISPSEEMFRRASESRALGSFSHFHIPNHFPSDVFHPLDKLACREILQLPERSRVVLFVADSLQVNLKGFEFLKRAFQELDLPEETILCSVGDVTIESTLADSKWKHLGHIRDERLMAVAYSAADVFVIPSLEDNLPNTMIESILCGTPVIGFPTGGIVDAIGEQLGNGYICEEISVAALKQALMKFLESPDVFDRGRISREAAAKYTGNAVTSLYLELYRSVLSERVQQGQK